MREEGRKQRKLGKMKGEGHREGMKKAEKIVIYSRTQGTKER